MGELSDEVVIDVEGVSIVAKCGGKTYHSAGAAALPEGFKHYVYMVPDEERTPDGINQIYLIFKDGKIAGAMGFVKPLNEISLEQLSDPDIVNVVEGGNPKPPLDPDIIKVIEGRLWYPPSVRIDGQLRAVLLESIPPYRDANAERMKAIGDVLGMFFRTEFLE